MKGVRRCRGNASLEQRYGAMKIAHRTTESDAGDEIDQRQRVALAQACQAGKPDVRIGVALALGLLVSLGAGPPVPGLGLGTGGMSKAGTGLSQGIPTQSYFSHQAAMYDGDYKDALEAFRMDLAGGIKTSQSRWIDSICYYTAMGECCYRMGRLGDALDNYNAAVKLYLAFPNWMQ